MNYKRKSRSRFFLLTRSRTSPITSEFRRGGGLNNPNHPSRYATACINQLSVCAGLWLWVSEISSQRFFIRKPPETGEYRLESATRSQIRDSQSRVTQALRTGQCVSLNDSKHNKQSCLRLTQMTPESGEI